MTPPFPLQKKERERERKREKGWEETKTKKEQDNIDEIRSEIKKTRSPPELCISI